MEEKTEQQTLRKGFFPVRISVEMQTAERWADQAEELLHTFVQKMAEKYDLQVLNQPHKSASTIRRAEGVIAVPFPDRERIRIDFNIFASEMEEEHGTELYFHMESAF